MNGVWGAWGEFFPCDKACGGGIQLRFRKCDNPSPSNGGLQCIGDSLQSATCNDHPCKGVLLVVKLVLEFFAMLTLAARRSL